MVSDRPWRWLLAAAVCLLALASIGVADDHRPKIQTLDAGGQPVYLVDHDGDRLSLYAENVQLDALLEALEAAGGPSWSSREPLIRPVTMTVHAQRIEDVLRRLLDGYSFTYHYDERGRLERVRVLAIIPGRPYKTPPALESRSYWERVELGEAEPR